ncbi:MAG: IS4 family transposase [Terriglobales bacterium]
MLAPWAGEEMKTADLPDKRLNERLAIVLSQLAGQPTASIPAACGGYAETAAAYRLFENERLCFEDVLQPHIDATRRRVAEQPLVVLAQDTTELDFTRPQQQVVGAGPMDGSKRRGAFLHPLHAFTPAGVPLGTVAARVWARPDESPLSTAERQARRQKLPIEQKESQRWVDMLRRGQGLASEAPGTRFICVADSEADIYELLAEAETQPRRVDWIVRAASDRVLQNDTENAASAGRLHAEVMRSPVLFTKTITVRAREPKVACKASGRCQPRQARQAEVEVRAARVTLHPPHRRDRKLPPLTVHVVLVREIAPPPGEDPIEWMLLTSLPIATAEEVAAVIQYYCVRWMMEILFRTLKSGCRVEERRFETMDRLFLCVAVYLIVSWRTLFVCRMGRSLPDVSCEVIFEPAEWKSAWRVVRRSRPPTRPPKLRDMVRLVAQLGGYVNRSRKDEPGPQTVWLGLQRLHDITLCWQVFGPEAEAEAVFV